MLREFKKSHTEPVGITGNRYNVTIEGDVIDISTQTKISTGSIDEIEIIVRGKTMKVKPELVVAMGFKPLYDSEDFWFNWSILFVDGNNKNRHPGNLIWKPPQGGQECPNKSGFYIVPGHSQFAVNKDGTEVYSRRLNRLVKCRPNFKKPNQAGFYLVYNSWTDTERMMTAGVHRTVALALLEYSAHVDEVTVNHKDGIKNNNCVDNLEWATYSENNIHARDTGLCNTRIPVFVKDYKTGEVKQYKSMSHAATALGCSSARMTEKMRYRRDQLLDFRYVLSFADLVSNWPSYTWDELEEVRLHEEDRKKKLACAGYNIHTGQTFIADNPGELREYIHLTKDEMNTGLDSPYTWPTNNYVLWYLHNPKNIRSFKQDELIAFKDKTGIKNPLRVTYSDGSTKVFSHFLECAKDVGLEYETLRLRLVRKGGKTMVGDKIVEYVQP